MEELKQNVNNFLAVLTFLIFWPILIPIIIYGIKEKDKEIKKRYETGSDEEREQLDWENLDHKCFYY